MWLYKVIHGDKLGQSRFGIEWELNRLGAEGWEVVQVSAAHCYFKKRASLAEVLRRRLGRFRRKYSRWLVSRWPQVYKHGDKWFVV